MMCPEKHKRERAFIVYRVIIIIIILIIGIYIAPFPFIKCSKALHMVYYYNFSILRVGMSSIVDKSINRHFHFVN